MKKNLFREIEFETELVKMRLPHKSKNEWRLMKTRKRKAFIIGERLLRDCRMEYDDYSTIMFPDYENPIYAFLVVDETLRHKPFLVLRDDVPNRKIKFLFEE